MDESIVNFILNDINRRKEQSNTVIQATNDFIPIDYKINNNGFRGPEFEKNNELLILGCSFTHGQGLPQEYIWADILSKKLNMSYSNLGFGGDSAIGQISKAFYYFKNIGKPKIIVALFPSNRMLVPNVKDKLVSHNLHGEVRDSLFINQISLEDGEFKKYAKSPYRPEDIFPQELAFLYERIMLDMLEQYCETNDIKLFWSCWDFKYQYSLYHFIEKENQGYHKNYCYLESVFHEEEKKICHEEYRSHELFKIAADRLQNFSPHWGIHRNIHIADEFYDYIAKKI